MKDRGPFLPSTDKQKVKTHVIQLPGDSDTTLDRHAAALCELMFRTKMKYSKGSPLLSNHASSGEQRGIHTGSIPKTHCCGVASPFRLDYRLLSEAFSVEETL